MKRSISILFIVVLLSGCINQQLTDKYTFNEFMIGYKSNSKAGIGTVGVEYNDRIYYFSQESGESGIYSMKTDGSDIRLETEARDVQKLQVIDNNLYYLDYNGISYGSNKERWGNKAYSLKSKNLETNEIKEYKDIENKIKSIMEKYRKNNYRGLWDFYYLGDDEFIVGCLDPQVPTMQFILVNNKITTDGTVFDLNKAERISLENINLFELHKVGEDDYFVSDAGTNTYYGISVGRFSVYNSIIDSGFTVRDSVIKGVGSMDICFKENNNLIMRSKNCIASYDLEKKEINKTCVIDKAEKLMLFDKKYILAKFKNREEIYEFDKEDFSARKVLTNKKGYIIDVKDDGFIVIDKKYLYKKDLSGKEIWKVKLEKNYIKDEVKVEIVGDWLFIKSFDLKTEQSKLEEKIDLKNGNKTELEKLIN